MGKVSPHENVELHKIKGCFGCSRNCLNNKNIAIKDVAEQYREKFQCNDSHSSFDKEKI
jgi:hypothetical protein